jgi:hypothetical protein
LYQQPLSFKHQALVDLTLTKSPKDTREKGSEKTNDKSHDKIRDKARHKF